MNGWPHIGDNINMVGNGNTGKIVGGAPNQGPPVRENSNVVWRQPLVFVNYRRTDEKAACDLEAELTRQLGVGSVFRDAWMPAGTEFPGELVEQARSCAVMLSVIGERWDDAHGLRLLHDRTDWVRNEIAIALANGVQVVPVLVGARGRLAARDLPEDVRPLAYRQAPHLRSGYNAQDMSTLVDGLLRDLPALTVPRYRGY